MRVNNIDSFVLFGASKKLHKRKPRPNYPEIPSSLNRPSPQKTFVLNVAQQSKFDSSRQVVTVFDSVTLQEMKFDSTLNSANKTIKVNKIEKDLPNGASKTAVFDSYSDEDGKQLLSSFSFKKGDGQTLDVEFNFGKIKSLVEYNPQDNITKNAFYKSNRVDRISLWNGDFKKLDVSFDSQNGELSSVVQYENNDPKKIIEFKIDADDRTYVKVENLNKEGVSKSKIYYPRSEGEDRLDSLHRFGISADFMPSRKTDNFIQASIFEAGCDAKRFVNNHSKDVYRLMTSACKF